MLENFHGLLHQDVFDFVPGRKHSAFPVHNRSPVHNLSPTTLLNWMKTLRRKFAKGNLSFLTYGNEEDGNEEDRNEGDGNEGDGNEEDGNEEDGHENS